MKRILSVLLALGLLLGGLSAMAETADGGKLVVGSTTQMSGNFFSEMFGNNTSDIDMRTLLHGYNLMQWAGEIQPGAYSTNPSVVSGIIALDDDEGNRTYTIMLYSDLVYSDGTPITTADYAFSMLLTVAPEMTEIGAQTVVSDYIVGSDAYKAGETNVLSGMRILSDTMMSITVKAEYEPFFYELSLLDYNPYPISVIAPGCEVVDEGEGVFIRNIDETVEEPIFTADLLRETVLDPETGYLSHPSVVTGAYVLDSYDAQTHTATLSINPYFKGDAYGCVPSIQTLVFKPVSPSTMIDELRNGEVDLLNKCTSANVIMQGRELAAGDGFSAANYPRSGYSFISFSCERPATSSDVVRKAIAHCLNKNALVSAYVGDYGIVVNGYYGLGQWMFSLAIGAQMPPLTEEQTYADWSGVNLTKLQVYDFDVDEAIRLLEKDGWTLNRDGGEFDPQTDDARCKEIDGELIALDLKMIYPEDNAVGYWLNELFVRNLAKAGVVVTVEAKPMAELLDVYYRNVEREYDLIYLATNFERVFDPSYTFSPADAYQGKSNRSGIADEELYRLALDMSLTAPGDVLTYCLKWVALQQRFTEVLPAIPVYSNIYYDFYIDNLRNYAVSADQTWAESIIRAFLIDPEMMAMYQTETSDDNPDPIIPGQEEAAEETIEFIEIF